jgi:hypothetical protein
LRIVGISHAYIGRLQDDSFDFLNQQKKEARQGFTFLPKKAVGRLAEESLRSNGADR